MKRLIPLFPLVALLSGCAQGPTLDQRLSTFVGRSEGDLVAALGVPARTYETEGRRFLQFEQRRTVPYASPGHYHPYYGPFGGPFGPRFGYMPGPPVYGVVGCDITLALRGGRVENFTYRGEGCG